MRNGLYRCTTSNWFEFDLEGAQDGIELGNDLAENAQGIARCLTRRSAKVARDDKDKVRELCATRDHPHPLEIDADDRKAVRSRSSKRIRPRAYAYIWRFVGGRPKPKRRRPERVSQRNSRVDALSKDAEARLPVVASTRLLLDAGTDGERPIW